MEEKRMALPTVKRSAKLHPVAPSLANDEPPNPDWLLVSMLRDIFQAEKRYKVLRLYAQGDPPRPRTPGAVEDSWKEFEDFRKKSRTNYAELIVGACLDRTRLQGFRTAAKNDEDGDLEAQKIWDENDMEVRSDRVFSDMFTYGRGLLVADPLTKRAKDFRPWQGKVVYDRIGEPVVGIAVEHAPMERRDYCYLWQREIDENGIGYGPVAIHIAVRDRQNTEYQGGTFGTEVPVTAYLSQGWSWWKSETSPVPMIPMVEFENRDGIGEFENHTDVLDRINHMLLQRVVIVTMQAFRQRALKGEFPKTDPKTGEKIDYDKLFPADPGALWLLPPDAEVWESAQTTVQDILASVKDDVRDLAAVSRTPMTYFSPDSANGSAEGADLQREGYTSKIDDRKARTDGRWRRWMHMMFLLKGDEERASIAELEPMWVPTRVLSVSERYQAGLAAKGTGLPLKTIMRMVLNYSPKEIRAAELDRISEMLTQAASTPVNGSATGGAGPGQPSLTPLQQSAASRQTMAASNGATSRTTGASSGRAGN